MATRLIIFLSLMGVCSVPAQQKILPDDDAISIQGCRYLVKQGDGSIRLSRFDRSIGKLPVKEIGFNWEKAQATTGVRLFFKSNSPELTLLFRMDEKDLNRGSEFGVFINGKWHKRYTFWKSHGNELKVKIDSGSSEMKKYEVTLPSFSNPHFVGMEIGNDSQIVRVEEQKKKTYVAMGDSITHGQGQGSATYKTYPYLLAKKLDVDFYNLAVGGGKISIPAARQLKDWQKIDLMTVLVGYNDWCFDGKSPDNYRMKYKEFLRVIRSNHPETKIYCITLLYTKNNQARKTDYKPEQFREALVSLVDELQQAGDKNIFLIKGDKITSEKNLQADKPKDPVHLGEEGAKLLADELFKRIEIND